MKNTQALCSMPRRVSVITPTYNRAHLLSRVWQSLRGQTVADFEWIIVDDGSLDESASIVAAFADDRIRYVRQENKGVNAARNLGMAAATAPFLVFLDSDDELCGTDALEFMLGEMAQTPADVAVGYFGVKNGTGGGELYEMAGERFIAGYEDHICRCRFRGEFFQIFRREALESVSWPADVAGLELLLHWAVARQWRTLFVSRKTRIYHADSADGLSTARSAIRRAPSLAIGQYRLIDEHKAAWLRHCPQQFGRHSFYLALYRALADGMGVAAPLLVAWRWGDRSIKFKTLLLGCTLVLPACLRRALFVRRMHKLGR